ncbi:MAG: hypothetical protein H6726_12835 [Sandaracinaceae bacterium]|nr:hypothetical protein [Myxococcales bacterium]MCB9658526.1 hypothetical protein [Sandaracinaceae bacterium]
MAPAANDAGKSSDTGSAAASAVDAPDTRAAAADAAGPAGDAPATAKAGAEDNPKDSPKDSPRESNRQGDAAPASAEAKSFDAAAHDRFASSFKPSWQVANDGAGASPAEVAQREHALSGEISLDAIPLPPLPTEKPKRQVIGVVVVLLLIIGAGVAASMRGSEPTAPQAPADAPSAAE